jgi:uncharacterized membrane protein YciS (DUF1049 family)
MRYLVRTVVLLAVAVAVGWSVDRLILRHSTVRDGGYGPQVRLGAATGGLFAAGAAVTVVVIAMAMGRKK